jgi:hypothetical protein
MAGAPVGCCLTCAAPALRNPFRIRVRRGSATPCAWQARRASWHLHGPPEQPEAKTDRPPGEVRSNGTGAKNGCSSAWSNAGWQAPRHLPAGSSPGRRCRCSVRALPDWERLPLLMFRYGQGEGGRVDLDGEPVGRIDRVAVELHRLGSDCRSWSIGPRQSDRARCPEHDRAGAPAHRQIVRLRRGSGPGSGPEVDSDTKSPAAAAGLLGCCGQASWPRTAPLGKGALWTLT